jgi:hypothetical protein
VESAQARTIRINTHNGTADSIETELSDWTISGTDDLAVLRLPLDHAKHKFSFVAEEQFLTEQDLDDYLIGPGDEAVLLGRFVNHEGSQRNTPSARFGNISMMPGEPVAHPDGYPQVSFLTEIHSIGGYSGSPVVTYIPPEELPYRRSPKRGCRPWLLGVDWGHMDDWYKVRLPDRVTEHSGGLGVKHNTGMAYVVPAWRLRTLL